ncbi:MAG: penicillin-binding protein 2 [Alphaproteobacteria bacterium]|nr:penicillin-binding protein 2 [Alphaproteobacteria bacterium]
MSRTSRRDKGEGPPFVRIRLAIAGLFMLAAYAVIGGRLLWLAIDEETPSRERVSQLEVPVLERADIVDRNGRILATNVPVDALYADTRHIWDPKEAAQELARVLPELDVVELEQKLSSGAAFEWIKRDLTPRQYASVRALGIAGLAVKREQRRVYPNGHSAAHLLGYVNLDNRGIAGVEASLDTTLRDPKRGGEPVTLSIDLRVQHVLEDELASAIETFSAEAAAGIVLDIHTGEVLGMASLPDFDPNAPNYDPNNADEDTKARMFNRASLGVYEMGSTFKAMTTAMALDAGVVTINSTYDVRKPIRIGRFTIHDYKPKTHPLTVTEIFEYSSNIGTAHMAMDIGASRQQIYFDLFGMFKPAPIELPEVGAPLLPQKWGDVTTMTVSYGHGIAVSPIQTAAAFAAVANGGLYIAPTLLKRPAGTGVPVRRVVSENVSAEMRTLLRRAVTEGTGGQADVPGYPVGGKTGTAEKAVGGGYDEKSLISSFIGVFPALSPRYLVLIILDEPQGTEETHGYATAGWTAAPTTGKVVSRIGPLLGVRPEPIPLEVTDGATQMAAQSDR